MKRFMVFIWVKGKPLGGMKDFVKDFSSMSYAMRYLKENNYHIGDYYEYQVYDCFDKKISSNEEIFN